MHVTYRGVQSFVETQNNVSSAKWEMINRRRVSKRCPVAVDILWLVHQNLPLKPLQVYLTDFKAA
jgi:hypothetical protein